jgi:hypothetical protein
MRVPWQGKTGLAKAAVILTTILSIATVTCGINLGLVLGTLYHSSAWQTPALFVAGQLELLAIGGSLAGLLVVLVMWLVSKWRGRSRKDNHD